MVSKYIQSVNQAIDNSYNGSGWVFTVQNQVYFIILSNSKPFNVGPYVLVTNMIQINRLCFLFRLEMNNETFDLAQYLNYTQILLTINGEWNKLCKLMKYLFVATCYICINVWLK